MVLNSCAFLGEHEEAKREKQMDHTPGKITVPTVWCQPMVGRCFRLREISGEMKGPYRSSGEGWTQNLHVLCIATYFH